jgi:hypothetical protein
MHTRCPTLIMNPFGRPKPKGKLPEDAHILIRAVFTLDALRVGLFPPELRNLHKELKESRLLSGEGMSWSSLRREINELINFPEKSERTANFARRLPILSILLIVGFAATGIGVALDIYIFHFSFPLYVIVVPGMVFMSAVSTVRWHYEESIRGLYEKSKPKADKIRRINNQLIGRMILVLQKSGYPLKDCSFGLYNADYQNISVKKQPRFYRGYYEVYPSPGGKQL